MMLRNSGGGRGVGGRGGAGKRPAAGRGRAAPTVDEGTRGRGKGGGGGDQKGTAGGGDSDRGGSGGGTAAGCGGGGGGKDGSGGSGGAAAGRGGAAEVGASVISPMSPNTRARAAAAAVLPMSPATRARARALVTSTPSSAVGGGRGTDDRKRSASDQKRSAEDRKRPAARRDKARRANEGPTNKVFDVEDDDDDDDERENVAHGHQLTRVGENFVLDTVIRDEVFTGQKFADFDVDLKFSNNPESICRRMAQKLAVEDDEVEDWWDCTRSHVHSCLKKHRNNIIKGIKKLFQGKTT
jgi:hypothetical protein